MPLPTPTKKNGEGRGKERKTQKRDKKAVKNSGKTNIYIYMYTKEHIEVHTPSFGVPPTFSLIAYTPGGFLCVRYYQPGHKRLPGQDQNQDQDQAKTTLMLNNNSDRAHI